jgi:hypothetical protein
MLSQNIQHALKIINQGRLSNIGAACVAKDCQMVMAKTCCRNFVCVSRSTSLYFIPDQIICHAIKNKMMKQENENQYSLPGMPLGRNVVVCCRIFFLFFDDFEFEPRFTRQFHSGVHQQPLCLFISQQHAPKIKVSPE